MTHTTHYPVLPWPWPITRHCCVTTYPHHRLVSSTLLLFHPSYLPSNLTLTSHYPVLPWPWPITRHCCVTTYPHHRLVSSTVYPVRDGAVKGRFEVWCTHVFYWYAYVLHWYTRVFVDTPMSFIDIPMSFNRVRDGAVEGRSVDVDRYTHVLHTYPCLTLLYRITSYHIISCPAISHPLIS